MFNSRVTNDRIFELSCNLAVDSIRRYKLLFPKISWLMRVLVQVENFSTDLEFQHWLHTSG